MYVENIKAQTYLGTLRILKSVETSLVNTIVTFMSQNSYQDTCICMFLKTFD